MIIQATFKVYIYKKGYDQMMEFPCIVGKKW